MKGQQQWEYLPPSRPGARERHQARRVLVVLGASMAVGVVIGWRLGR